MRFIAFRMRNTDPAVPATVIDYPMVVDEDGVCSRNEERFRCEGLICEQWWDDDH